MELCQALPQLVTAEEPGHEGHAALGTTATWWQTSELQAWRPQQWPLREADSTRRPISCSVPGNPPGTRDSVPIGAWSFVDWLQLGQYQLSSSYLS